MTVEQLAENHTIKRWVCNTFVAQKRWTLTDVDAWSPENIRLWAQESGPGRITALYERNDNVSLAEFEALLDLHFGLAELPEAR